MLAARIKTATAACITHSSSQERLLSVSLSWDHTSLLEWTVLPGFSWWRRCFGDLPASLGICSDDCYSEVETEMHYQGYLPHCGNVGPPPVVWLLLQQRRMVTEQWKCHIEGTFCIVFMHWAHGSEGCGPSEGPHHGDYCMHAPPGSWLCNKM